MRDEKGRQERPRLAMHDDEVPPTQPQSRKQLRIRGELLMVAVAAAAMLTAVLVVGHLEDDPGALADARRPYDAAAGVGAVEDGTDKGSDEEDGQRAPAANLVAVDA